MAIRKQINKRVLEFDPVDFEPIRKIALTFPGAEDSVSHEGTPSIKVRGKLMCRLHDNGKFIPIQVGFENRQVLLEKYPDEFTVPDHFIKYPYIAMWVPQKRLAVLREVVEMAWRQLVPKNRSASGKVGSAEIITIPSCLNPFLRAIGYFISVLAGIVERCTCIYLYCTQSSTA